MRLVARFYPHGRPGDNPLYHPASEVPAPGGPAAPRPSQSAGRRDAGGCRARRRGSRPAAGTGPHQRAPPARFDPLWPPRQIFVILVGWRSDQFRQGASSASSASSAWATGVCAAPLPTVHCPRPMAGPSWRWLTSRAAFGPVRGGGDSAGSHPSPSITAMAAWIPWSSSPPRP